MATFHVFIERPREEGPEASARLAAAVADRYGIPQATLVQRLAAGRLRVKTGVDRATAETFAADLEKLGAVCAIVDVETNEAVAKPKPKPAPAPVLPAPVAAKPVAVSTFSSALSAARTGGGTPQQELGALSSGEFALATLDGADDGGAPAGSFGPPGGDVDALPASMGPPLEMPPGAPTDAFAPPDSDVMPELALDVAARPERTPGTTAPAAPPPPSTMAVAPPEAPPRRAAGRRGWRRDARVRFAGGVLGAILLGFVPATAVMSVRESPAFAEIDAELARTYDRARDERDWLRLDAARDRAISRKRDTRRNLALGSMVIWALAGGAIAYGWFRAR